MTDTESRDQLALHTVFATCIKPFPKAFGDKLGVLQARNAYLENRLDEVRLIAERRVIANAIENTKGD